MGALRTGTIVLGFLTLSSTALADGDGYEPSRFRIYAGPALWVPFYANNFDVFAIGGTAAFQWYADSRRIVFIGGRLAFLGDPQGLGRGYVGGYVDGEVGVRPRLISNQRNALTVVVSGSAGGGFIQCPCSAPTIGDVHMSLRAGLGFDLGAFTMDALVGPTVLWNGDGASGAVETLLEGGLRFR